MHAKAAKMGKRIVCVVLLMVIEVTIVIEGDLEVRCGVLPSCWARVSIHMAGVVGQSETAWWFVLCNSRVARVHVVVGSTQTLVLPVSPPEQNRNGAEENRTTNATDNATDNALGLG